MPLKVSHGIKSWIDDFQQSKDKRFDGKSAEKRREMAIAAYMAAKREQKENVKSADRKPQVFTKPDGKKGVRMVPVDREVVKQEKNLEWLKAALEAQARKAKPCDEDVEETSEAKVDELSMSLKDIQKTGLNKAASGNKEKLKKDLEAMKAKLNKEAKVDEVSLDKAKSAYYKRKSQAQGAAAQGSMDYAKKQMAKARKTKAYIDKRESVEEAVDLEMHKKAAASHAAKAKPVGKRWPKGAEQHDNAARAHQHVINMHRKFGADHDGTKDAIKAAKAASQKASGMKKTNEVLDRPGALDSYRKKADASGNRARNSATRKILRGPDKDGKRADHSDELNTMRKRNKGQDMADRAANRHFRKSLGLGYNSKKESVELDENKYAAKAAERHKNLMKQARSDMKRATSHSDMIKHMNKYQAANKAYDRATRGQFDEKKVDEISNAKMGQYVRKAADDAARRAMDAGEKAGRGDSKGFGKQMVKSRQRVKGVQKAMDKMDKNRLYGRQ
jgi:hypothetical protein